MGGSNSQRDAIMQNSRAEQQIADAQANLAATYGKQVDTNQQLQDRLSKIIVPYATSLMGGYDPSKYANITAPDLTKTINQQYAQQLADIEQKRNEGIASTADLYKNAGMGKSGFYGAALGGQMGGAEQATSQAGYQRNTALNQAKLQEYYNKLQQQAQEAQIANTGASEITGQQAVFNPIQWAQAAEGGYAGASGSRNAANSGFYSAAQLPSTFSSIMGGVGGLLGAAGGLPGITKAGTTMGWF